MKYMASTQFSMRISDELKKSLENISKITNRSQSQIASIALADYVKRIERKLKALEEVKQGDLISQEAAIQWLDNWEIKSEEKEAISIKKESSSFIDSDDEMLERLMAKQD